MYGRKHVGDIELLAFDEYGIERTPGKTPSTDYQMQMLAQQAAAAAAAQGGQAPTAAEAYARQTGQVMASMYAQYGGSVISTDAVIPRAQTNIRPVTSAANAAGAPVSYTGDPAVDNATEAGTDVVASGRNMLLWLGIGTAALWVLFAKGRRA